MNWVAAHQEKNLNEALGGYKGSSADLLDALWTLYRRQCAKVGHTPRFCAFCRWWKPNHERGFSNSGVCSRDYQSAGWSDTCGKWEEKK